jgi:hypothetical protein
MRLCAVFRDELTPAKWYSGRVGAIFHGACSVRPRRGSLLTFLPAEAGKHPAAIGLDTNADFDFRHHLRSGEAVQCRAGIVRFAGSELSIDLRTAKSWSSLIPDLRTDMSRPRSLRAWHGAWRELLAHRDRGGFGALLLSRSGDGLAGVARPAVSALFQTTRRNDAYLAAKAAERLVGLGPGHTPSGDDFLVGYLTGLRTSSGGTAARKSFLAELSSRVAHEAQATTETSRQYLRLAAEGRVAESVSDLAARIGSGDSDEVVGTVSGRLFRMGHSSGVDVGMGLLMGIAAWETASATSATNAVREDISMIAA